MLGCLQSVYARERNRWQGSRLLREGSKCISKRVFKPHDSMFAEIRWARRDRRNDRISRDKADLSFAEEFASFDRVVTWTILLSRLRISTHSRDLRRMNRVSTIAAEIPLRSGRVRSLMRFPNSGDQTIDRSIDTARMRHPPRAWSESERPGRDWSRRVNPREMLQREVDRLLVKSDDRSRAGSVAQQQGPRRENLRPGREENYPSSAD